MLFLVMMALGATPAGAYSLLTHEQLIDLTWNDSIVPLLLSRYPSLTPAQVEHARAYAYGGCVIQDIGYYPFGDQFFSNLTHYVRTGDFVVNLFRNAGNADELAFAIGALSHYIGDAEGHSLATNRAVPIEFPRLGKKYGPVVNYGEGKTQHVRTEFAFDINELAHDRMAPFRYQKHIGLALPVRQLALAYYQTYGLTKGFSGAREQRINVGAYRFAVRAFIPRIARAVTILHRQVEPADPNTPEILQLRKEVAAVAAENHWDQYRSKAGIGIYSLAALIFILPKIGPLRMAAVKGPTVNTQSEYVHSVAVSTGALRRILARFTPPPQQLASAAQAASSDVHSQPSPSHPLAENPSPAARTPRDSRDPRHPLKNRDLDTGNVVQPGGYRLTDATYAELLHILAQQSKAIPPGIKEDILAYYANLDLPITTKKDPEKWKQVLADLETLKNVPTSPELKPYPTYGEDEEDQQ
ncbi:MAG TPA: zinc dependent phospholipase C family protein [Terracidiphilus sp.]